MSFILHHYNISPYSEMIRLMLGYTNIDWYSAICPPMPPRHTVDPLTGGYRRIPVAQIGADIYCDTRIISSEISKISGTTSLDFKNCASNEQDFIRQIGAQYFMAIVQTAKPSSVLSMLVKRYWPWQIIALMRDRATVAKNSKLTRVGRQEQLRLGAEFKAIIQARLESKPFLFKQYPSLGDFAAYHLLWFNDLTRPTKFAENSLRLREWQIRIAAFGHGNYSKIANREVFEAASKNEPAAITITNEHALADCMVTVGPIDYALNTTAGKLVGSDNERLIIKRETESLGTLHVHLPHEGYHVTKS